VGTGTALFSVVYLCLSSTLCVEQHRRLIDDFQHLSAEECTQKAQSGGKSALAEFRAYCQHEKVGPNYDVVFDLKKNTVRVQMVPKNY
jgi:hypothetical protein